MTESWLSIDVDAEIRKISSAQHQRPLDAVADTLRLLIRWGSDALTVQRHRRGVRLVGHGARHSPGSLERLRCILDSRATDEERHRAMLASERNDGLAWLALAARPRFHVDAAPFALTRAQGAVHLSRTGTFPGVAIDMDLTLSRRELTELGHRLRFVRIPVTIAGRALLKADDFEASLATATFHTARLRGIVAIPPRDELCRTVLLCQQVVLKELTAQSSEGFTHVAVVEDIEAREAAHLDEEAIAAAVHDTRAGLFQHLLLEVPKLPPEKRQAARRVLLRRAQKLGSSWLWDVRLWQRVQGEPLILQELPSLQREGVLWAVDAAATNVPPLPDPTRVLRLDANDRQFLTETCGFIVTAPPTPHGASLWERQKRRLRTVLEHIRRLVSGVGARLLGAPWLSTVELDDDERLFLARVTEELHSGRYAVGGLPWGTSRQLEVAFVRRGVLPPKVRKRGRTYAWAIPRQHPLVHQAIVRIGREPWDVYPLLCALGGGHDGYGARKQQWHRALLHRPPQQK